MRQTRSVRALLPPQTSPLSARTPRRWSYPRPSCRNPRPLFPCGRQSWPYPRRGGERSIKNSRTSPGMRQRCFKETSTFSFGENMRGKSKDERPQRGTRAPTEAKLSKFFDRNVDVQLPKNTEPTHVFIIDQAGRGCGALTGILNGTKTGRHAQQGASSHRDRIQRHKKASTSGTTNLPQLAFDRTHCEMTDSNRKKYKTFPTPVFRRCCGWLQTPMRGWRRSRQLGDVRTNRAKKTRTVTTNL